MGVVRQHRSMLRCVLGRVRASAGWSGGLGGALVEESLVVVDGDRCGDDVVGLGVQDGVGWVAEAGLAVPCAQGADVGCDGEHRGFEGFVGEAGVQAGASVLAGGVVSLEGAEESFDVGALVRGRGWPVRMLLEPDRDWTHLKDCMSMLLCA